MSTSTAVDVNLFETAVKTIFDSWTAIQIAKTNGFGGSASETKEKYDWFVNATFEWMIENGDLEDYELEEFFLNTMDKEFDTILEDQSEAQVARNLIGAYNLYKSQQYSVLESEIAKLKHQIAARPSATNESVKLKTGETDESSSEDGTDNGTSNISRADSKRVELEEEMECVEEGWTYVAKSGKHHTKQ